MTGRMSRNKGSSGEREFARVLSEAGWPSRRGRQYCGGPESPDVVTELEGYHFEVKRVERLRIYPSLEQAGDDSADGEIPVVAHRKNHKHWIVLLEAKAFLGLIKENERLSRALESRQVCLIKKK